jgi:hypothetical protein
LYGIGGGVVGTGRNCIGRGVVGMGRNGRCCDDSAEVQGAAC